MISESLLLNDRALDLVDGLTLYHHHLRIAESTVAAARVLDFGVKARGGLQAGIELARVCLADLGTVSLAPPTDGSALPLVTVSSDQPIRACLQSQYAGWQVAVGQYFGMGSGPMRAKYGKEAIFADIGGREDAPAAVGVLESRRLPTEEVVAHLAEKLQLPAGKVTLLVAPVTSLAGTVQVVARCLETALHKLHELKFDLTQVVSGYGVAPLPPPAKDDLTGLGRTNDAILYGGRAVVWVDAEDDVLAAVGPQVPATASPQHGRPFAELFAETGHDFYKIDPHLFAPAEIVLCNLRSGRSFAFGRCAPEVLRRSFS